MTKCIVILHPIFSLRLIFYLLLKTVYILIAADVAEIKRVTTTDTYLHTLHKYTNYSIQVLAFTGAGDGKRSAPAYCITEEDGQIYP